MMSSPSYSGEKYIHGVKPENTERALNLAIFAKILGSKSATSAL